MVEIPHPLIQMQQIQQTQMLQTQQMQHLRTQHLLTNQPMQPPPNQLQSGPKRISFTKGSTNAIEYFDLEVGESKKFVIGAAKGQDLTIGNGGDVKITMITKGKLVDETNDETSYNGTTIGGGDFIFEVTNTAKKKIKSSVNVMIQTIGDD